MPEQDNVIATDQLQIGIYVYLDVGWMHHPFSFNNFKIKSESQLEAIKSLGLKKVRWDPERSDLKPLAAKPAHAKPQATAAHATPQAQALAATEETLAATTEHAAAMPAEHAEADAAAHTGETLPTAALAAAAAAETAAAHEAAVAAKKQRVERLNVQRQQIAQVQLAFAGTAATIRAISKNIFSQPKETVRQSETLVRKMVDELLAAPEVAIQVMSEKPGGEDIYLHSLNVSVLAMMIGRELKLSGDEVGLLGMGCLFHDIGMAEIPTKILVKTDPLTKAERDFLEMHCAYGVDIAKRVGLPAAVQSIIYRHHELQDGSGYPLRLKGEAIDLLSRIVSIAEHYDELCNPVNLAVALTPHEALSQMFAQQRAKFDPRLLQVFIRCLGVFPPGTVVRLNNDVVGLVISINAAKPLKPSVIIYDEDVPKNEAIIVDLDAEPDINISQAIRPAQLPKAIYEYLSPRKRISYYFDPDAGKQAKPA
ncbi:MAG: HD-GYP domain-containing protein [Rhodocyclales bacterium]|nr:HD-GYP domain-containing protein [Rhodocyclales bacterium]